MRQFYKIECPHCNGTEMFVGGEMSADSDIMHIVLIQCVNCEMSMDLEGKETIHIDIPTIN